MSNNSTTQKLQELFELYQSGALTKEEFDSLKSELLQNKNNQVTNIPEDEIISLENQLNNTSSKEEPVTKEKTDKANPNSEGILIEKQNTAPLNANKSKKSKWNYIRIVLILLLTIAGGTWMFMKVIGNHKDDIKDHISWNNKNIEVTTFNDFNGQEVDLDHQKSFLYRSGQLLKSDSNSSFGSIILEDTLSRDHILYVFFDESCEPTKENNYSETKVISALKIEHLNSSQISASCNSICENPNDMNSKYFSIVLDYKKDGKVTEFKTYKFDYKRKKIVENSNDSVICSVVEGDD